MIYQTQKIDENFIEIDTDNCNQDSLQPNISQYENFEQQSRKYVSQFNKNVGFHDQIQIYQVPNLFDILSQEKSQNLIQLNDIVNNSIEVEQLTNNIDKIQIPEKEAIKYIIPNKHKLKFNTFIFEMKKATNAPKFLLKTFLQNNIQKYLPCRGDTENHRKYLKKFQNQLENKTRTRFHLIQVFGSGQTQIQKKRNKLHRQILQKLLSQQRFILILDNNMIPKKNKIHYLYFSKVYEWRLNDSELTGRFN